MSHVKVFSHLLSKGDPLIFGPLVNDLKKHLKKTTTYIHVVSVKNMINIKQNLKIKW